MKPNLKNYHLLLNCTKQRKIKKLLGTKIDIDAFQPTVAFDIETSMTGFNMKCNSGLKRVKLGLNLCKNTSRKLHDLIKITPLVLFSE